MPYLGKTPSQATRQRYYKTASGGETSISGTMTTGGTLTFNDGEFVDVSVNGVALVAGTDYNTSTANTIAGLSALAANDQVEIVVYDTFSVFGGNVDGDFNINNGTLAAEAVTVTSLTSTGDVKLGDSDVLYLGDGLDLQIQHNGSGTFITDAGTGDLHIRTDTNLNIQNAAGSENKAVFTTDGAVELYHDNDKKFETTSSGVSITGGFAATDGCTISTADNDAQLTLTSTDADATVGPILKLHRDSSSPATSDIIGQILFHGEDDAGNDQEYARITTSIRNPAHLSEASNFTIETQKAGDKVSRLKMNENETVFNEDSKDIDFRVEGNGNANALVVHGADDFVGIGLGTPKKRLHIQDTSSDGMIILDRADTSADHQICFAHNYGNSNQSGGNYFGIGVDDSENRLVFAFDANSQASLSSDAKMALDANGTFLVAKTSTDKTVSGFAFEPGSDAQCHMTAASGINLILNRQTSDGTLVQLRHADTTEGSIVVSGSTVSYNGGHLSRWSRLLDGSRSEALLKGTVMSNLDDMITWSHDEVLWTENDKLPKDVSAGDVRRAAYTEDNEQLNHTKASDTEGDINVAGVFVAWDDDDDDYEDFYIAMTGDFVIRIGKDTTVARGDLLMSAGDGTAKPQGDDIVRSKTIAKVTSVTKSHTYDDGSYLVPCVLMAC